MITQERLKELLRYNPETGHFYWQRPPRRGVGVTKPAGSTNKLGYRSIKLGDKSYYAHRLAWLYIHGSFPPDEIDHINGNPSDNQLANLRLATHAQNLLNYPKPAHNQSGFKGVSWDKWTCKWVARARHNRVSINLGRFTTPEEAAAKYNAFAAQHHGEFLHSSTAQL